MQNIALLLENEDVIIKSFEQLFEDEGDFGLELRICKTYEDYEVLIKDDHDQNRIKCLIMDLSNNEKEDTSLKFKSVEFINQQFSQNRIPIFIHSGYLENFTDLEGRGTVYKIEKSSNSSSQIFNSIKLMASSGFLNIFSKGGTLEQKIMNELHSAFIKQFKPNEIDEIILSIAHVSADRFTERTIEVFERIALRAVYQNVISNKETNEPIKVNSIEHYYRRTDNVHKYWTGDIFKNNSSGELIFIVTPRCNLSNSNFHDLLICKLDSIPKDEIEAFNKPKDAEKKISNRITDNLVAESKRFLPKTPQFEGGYVNFIKIFSFPKVQMDEEYTYLISLVDDLTNDVVRKLAAYLLRGGISSTEYSEALYYFKE